MLEKLDVFGQLKQIIISERKLNEKSRCLKDQNRKVACLWLTILQSVDSPVCSSRLVRTRSSYRSDTRLSSSLEEENKTIIFAISSIR